MSRLILVILFIFAIQLASGQEKIVADITKGCDSLFVSFELQLENEFQVYSSVDWNFGDGEFADGALAVTHAYVVPGVYNVRCVLDGNKIINSEFDIVLGETPYADFEFKDTTPTEAAYTYIFRNKYFTPIEGIDVKYLWTFPDNSTSTDSVAEYVFDENEEGVYVVGLQLTDENGCSGSIEKKIPVSKTLMVPNVFSPNGDELNDNFIVTTSGEYTYEFKVFTLKGFQVYSSSSPEIRWDGRTVDGREASEGVYYYVIQSDETPVETALSGYIHLFR